jgi:hypothetical protein
MAVTTAAVVGIVSAGVTAGMSFSQASKQRKAMNQAEKDADEAMQEARKKLDINVYDKLEINKEPFELQRQAMLSQGAQAIQAGVESERGAAATAGRIQMAQNEGQAGIRTAMGQDLQQLEMLSAQEEGRLRDIGVQLDLEEVAGAQLAAANAQELQAQAMQQGFEGVQSMATQLATDANQELYGRANPFNPVIGDGSRRAQKQLEIATAQQTANFNNPIQQKLLEAAKKSAAKPLYKNLSSLKAPVVKDIPFVNKRGN